MKILILGGDGMLGHRLFLSLRASHEVRVTLRQELQAYSRLGLFSPRNAYGSIDVQRFQGVMEVLADFRPEAVVNCVGIVKQRASAKESIPSLEINALFPHRLALACRAMGARMIHLSTDCVFSGRKGNYLETDIPDCDDLYGKTKLLGEVGDPPCLTLRTSIIGPELSRKSSLLEWFLAQSGSVKGYKNAIFSGFTTLEMSRIIERMLLEHPEAHGIYQASSDPISKYDLLCLIKEQMKLSVEIEPDEAFRCDRSLESMRFRREFGYEPPSWPAMISDMIETL